jgi:hypothetical protein
MELIVKDFLQEEPSCGFVKMYGLVKAKWPVLSLHGSESTKREHTRNLHQLVCFSIPPFLFYL